MSSEWNLILLIASPFKVVTRTLQRTTCPQLYKYQDQKRIDISLNHDTSAVSLTTVVLELNRSLKEHQYMTIWLKGCTHLFLSISLLKLDSNLAPLSFLEKSSWYEPSKRPWHCSQMCPGRHLKMTQSGVKGPKVNWGEWMGKVSRIKQSHEFKKDLVVYKRGWIIKINFFIISKSPLTFTKLYRKLLIREKC